MPYKNQHTSAPAERSMRRGWQHKLRYFLADVHRSHLPYMLMLTHAPLFLNIQENLFRQDPMLGGADAKSWMRLAYFIGAGLFFSFSTLTRMKDLARSLAVGAAVFFVLWLMLPPSAASVGAAILYAFCFGGCATVAAFHYVYALNTAERFFGATLSVLYLIGFQLMMASGLFGAALSRLYIGGIVLLNLISALRYRTEDVTDSAKTSRPLGTKPLIVMVYVFFAYRIIKMLYTDIQRISGNYLPLVIGLAGLVGTAAAVILFYRSRQMIWHLLNLFFVGLIVAFILRLFVGTQSIPLILSFFYGFEQIGFIVTYTLLGRIFQRHADFRCFRWITVSLSWSFALVFILLRLLLPLRTVDLSLFAAWIALALLAGFIFLTPVLVKHIFNREIRVMADIPSPEPLARTPESPPDNPIERMLEMKKLTSREKEIILLILQGLIYKECAAELNISLNTVKFHVRNAYLKLNVNGRSHLFAVLHQNGGSDRRDPDA